MQGPQGPAGGVVLQPFGHGLGQLPYNQQALEPLPPNAQERHREKKRMERAARMERKMQIEQEEGGSFVGCSCAFSLLNIAMLVIPMLGNSWNHKQINGMGVKTMIIRTSLFMIDIDVKCGKNIVEDFLCKSASKMNGLHTLHDAQATACSISTYACSIMDKIYWGSFVIFVTYSTAIVSLLGGAGFLYFYWYHTHLVKVKKLALISFCLAPFFAAAGFTAWTAFVPDLMEVPRSWTNGAQGIIGGELMSYHATQDQDFQYGWCWCFSICSVLSMVVQLSTWPCCFMPHRGEDAAESAEEDRKMIMAGDMTAYEEAQPLVAPNATSLGVPTYGGPGNANFGSSYPGAQRSGEISFGSPLVSAQPIGRMPPYIP